MKRARPYDRDTALDAASNLFWTKGYHATSLKDLEAALDMKPGSIYAAFTNKETLFLAALERYYHRMRDGLRSEIDAAASPLTGLADNLRRIGHSADDGTKCRACMLIKTLLDTTASEAAIADQTRLYLDEVTVEFATILDRAKSLGELAPEADSQLLARRYQANMTALKIELHRGTCKADVAALANDMAHDWEQLRIQSVSKPGSYERV